jgi:hypothetical protein
VIPETRSRSTPGAGKWREMTPPQVTVDMTGVVPRAFVSESGCRCLVSQDPAKRAPAGMWLPPDELVLWHLSISHARRLPTWDEVADARYEFCPREITMALLLPPPDRYLNLHEFVLHVWQVDDRRTAQ